MLKLCYDYDINCHVEFNLTIFDKFDIFAIFFLFLTMLLND